ncbi:MAG: ATPase [Saprospiraceae bacterium]|nr:ATPase [Saprospiraceae bacterium]
MTKYKFTGEYEIRASVKMLFPYLSTPAGLGDWFADRVSIQNHIFTFEWDNEEHRAKIISQRANKYVKFEFLPENSEEEADPNYIEFRLDANEITESSFLKVSDYSSANNEEDLQNLWEGLIAALKEKVGG